jgi:hypothetical protein
MHFDPSHSVSGAGAILGFTCENCRIGIVLEHIDGSFVMFPDHDIGILRQTLDVGLMNDECGNSHSER